jgi:uncharacterized protein YkwD
MSLLIRPLALLVAAMSMISLAVVASGPLASAVTAESYGRAAERATNVVRRQHHLHRLRADRCLHRFAAKQAGRMAAQRRMFHQDIGVTLRACHLRTVGENVAVGFRSGRAVVRQGWMKSPPHRANILHRPYRLIAVVARQGSDGQWYASQVFGRR